MTIENEIYVSLKNDIFDASPNINAGNWENIFQWPFLLILLSNYLHWINTNFNFDKINTVQIFLDRLLLCGTDTKDWMLILQELTKIPKSNLRNFYSCTTPMPHSLKLFAPTTKLMFSIMVEF